MLVKLIKTLKNLIPRRVVNLIHFTRAVLAVLQYRYPARDMIVIGVTGTDGKTTTAHMIYAILRAAEIPTSLISTTGAIIPGKENQPLGLHVTTPNPFDLQFILRTAKEKGSKYVVLEATSHGLDQHRVLGSNFKIGVVTNITHEHLDYHGTWENYFHAKAKLFRSVEFSILNQDDPAFKRLKPLASGQIITYGLDTQADFTATEVEYSAEGTLFMIPEIGIRIASPFLGPYNLQNSLAAAATAKALEIDPKAIATGLQTASPPKGRLERVDMGQDFTIYIDFAHTPNSLKNMLALLRSVTHRNVIVVFGCAGDRDQEKRFPMGAIAARFADYTVITAEDPRTEDLETIMAQIAAGCESEGGVRDQTYFLIGDRQKAIDYAIQRLAQPDDIVVATGKAHEQSMCFGNTEYPWDEFQAIQNALKKKEAHY